MIAVPMGHRPGRPAALRPATTKFADYDADDPWSKIFDCTDGTRDIGLTGTCAAGQKVDFFLNFTPFVLDAAGLPMRDAAGGFLKSDDGCDIIYGDVATTGSSAAPTPTGSSVASATTCCSPRHYLEVDGGTQPRPGPERVVGARPSPTVAPGATSSSPAPAGPGCSTGAASSTASSCRSPRSAPRSSTAPSARTIQDFIRALAVAGGMDMTFAPALPRSTSWRSSTPRDSFWHDQHGGPRDPQPGNVGGVQIDYRGLVDLGVDCPCNPGIVIAVNGAVNAANPRGADDRRGRRVPPGRLLAPGSALALTYLVTNPGTTALQVLSITDDNATAADTATTSTRSTSPATPTATGCSTPGETWLYTAAGVAGAPQTALAG